MKYNQATEDNDLRYDRAKLRRGESSAPLASAEECAGEPGLLPSFTRCWSQSPLELVLLAQRLTARGATGAIWREILSFVPGCNRGSGDVPRYAVSYIVAR